MATAHFRYLTVNISLHAGIKKPDMTDKDKFYIKYTHHCHSNLDQETTFI